MSRLQLESDQELVLPLHRRPCEELGCGEPNQPRHLRAQGDQLQHLSRALPQPLRLSGELG